MAKKLSLIAMDVHSAFCEGGYIDQQGNEQGSWRKPTSVPELLEAIGSVPGIRKLIIEEGPLADWLYRSLAPHVDEMIVCDPHRNALISKDGDKSDAIDWRKLAALYRGGMIKAVHHQQSLARSLFKQRVQMYHERVSHRVSEAQKIIWRVRRLGVFIKEKDLADDDLRQAMLGKISEEMALEDVRLLLEGYDLAAEQVDKTKSRLIAMARNEPIVKSFCDIPGISWIRPRRSLPSWIRPFASRARCIDADQWSWSQWLIRRGSSYLDTGRFEQSEQSQNVNEPLAPFLLRPMIFMNPAREFPIGVWATPSRRLSD